MIPGFNELGYLPAGIHPATLEEIAERFGRQSDVRQAQMDSLRWLVVLARRLGVARIIVNGSFVTDAAEPNDVDCVLLGKPDSLLEPDAEEELDRGLPFLQVEFVETEGFRLLTEATFATDRRFNPKGMIEVISWT